MIGAVPAAPARPHALEAAIALACGSVAPSWPLDRQIAVNPWWGLTDRPFAGVASTLHHLAGVHFALPPDAYLAAWQRGDITPSALGRSLAEHQGAMTAEAALAALREPRMASDGLPLPSDILDEAARPGSAPRWRDIVTQQVSQYCASYFDEHQADWRRSRSRGFYREWRAALLTDHALEPLMHAQKLRRRSPALPDDATSAIAWALERLGVDAGDAAALLQLCLLRINGWASWCAWLGWQASLAGTTDAHLRELLAIRIGWEALLADDPGGDAACLARWRARWSRLRDRAPGAATLHDAIWQRAHEISRQDWLVGLLSRRAPLPAATGSAVPPAAQLYFCIDVRSERLRRALESVDPRMETHGVAGFFGLPIRYRAIGTPFTRPQLPGLVAPALEAADSTGSPDHDARIAAWRQDRLAATWRWQSFVRSPSGAFPFVEMLGLGFAGAIVRRHFGSGRRAATACGLARGDERSLRPRLAPAGDATIARNTDLVASILGAMGLTRGFARLIVLVGHGGQSANNPQAAALDCGACGGQTGEINARLLAALLNDAAVRTRLRGRGIDIPATTVAVAALHDTTTDEVTVADVDEVPASHAPDVGRLRQRLREAGSRARAERASDLQLGHLAARPAALLRALRRRARDWAETRPEWGLANNAAFVIAPRARTRGLDLRGRGFLHDYDATRDPDGRLLGQIMTAPMVVAHWINMQYFASTVDPRRYGSGNKVLHNVACGRIGVFEGNSGDLRIGLARQSVHDGRRWMHEPLRLSVFVDAPRERIEAILARHADVRRLVDHQWLYLFRFDADRLEWYRHRLWQTWT